MPLMLTHPQLLRDSCFIYGKWQSAVSGAAITVSNPYSGEVIGSVPALSAEEVRQVVTESCDAQISWAQMTAKARGALMQAWADLIDVHTEDLARIMTAEQGKPLTEARAEIAYANSFIRWFAEEGRRAYGDIIPANHAHLRHLVLKQPIGVCAAITPWNFPAAMITRKVAPALAAGCSMVVKPASETPFSALALLYLAVQAGIPSGVFSVVTGKASVVGEVLTQDKRIAKLSFTGSTQTGRQLAAACAGTLKKLSLELGGNAPFIVFADADLERAAEGLIASKYRNAGQTCVCANRVYVHEHVLAPFVEIFSAKVAALKVGDGMDKDVQVGALINQQALNRARALIQEALDKGAVLKTGGQVASTSPTLLMPTVLTKVRDDMAIADTEIFAPIAPIFSFKDEAEVIRRANASDYGLAAYFYGKDMAQAWRVTEALAYGMVAHNTGMLSTEVAPFGGVKQSGFGREGSKYGLDEYLTLKYWCVDVS